MKITIILGSIREGRKSDRVARYLHSLLNERAEVEVSLLDLRAHPMPMFVNRWAKEEQPHHILPKVSRQLEEADGIILVSPEYHGSYTGVLKNALDHFWKEFKRKVIGVVSTGSGRMGGINASVEMQQLVLSLGAYPVPQKLIVPFVQENFDENDRPKTDWLEKDCNKFVGEFLWLTKAVVNARERDLEEERQRLRKA